MPGLDPMSMPMDPMGMPMGPMGMPMGPSPDELIRLERQRREEELRQERINQASKVMREAQGMKPSPVRLKAKMDEDGLSSLGGALTIPLGDRIGLSVGGAYAPGRSDMGGSVPVNVGGQAVGQLKYTSPFLEAEVEYAPNRGFNGKAGIRGTWP